MWAGLPLISKDDYENNNYNFSEASFYVKHDGFTKIDSAEIGGLSIKNKSLIANSLDDNAYYWTKAEALYWPYPNIYSFNGNNYNLDNLILCESVKKIDPLISYYTVIDLLNNYTIYIEDKSVGKDKILTVPKKNAVILNSPLRKNFYTNDTVYTFEDIYSSYYFPALSDPTESYVTNYKNKIKNTIKEKDRDNHIIFYPSSIFVHTKYNKKIENNKFDSKLLVLEKLTKPTSFDKIIVKWNYSDGNIYRAGEKKNH